MIDSRHLIGLSWLMTAVVTWINCELIGWYSSTYYLIDVPVDPGCNCLILIGYQSDCCALIGYQSSASRWSCDLIDGEGSCDGWVSYLSISRGFLYLRDL